MELEDLLTLMFHRLDGTNVKIECIDKQSIYFSYFGHRYIINREFCTIIELVVNRILNDTNKSKHIRKLLFNK